MRFRALATRGRNRAVVHGDHRQMYLSGHCLCASLAKTVIVCCRKVCRRAAMADVTICEGQDKGG